MMLSILLLQAAATAAAPATVSPEARAKYEPYRRCMLAQAGRIDAAGKTDEVVTDVARQACMSANLFSGTQALFAEMRAGASKPVAIEHLAAFRSGIEAEALAAIRAAPTVRP